MEIKMFKKLVNQIKKALFKAQKIDANSAIAKAQSKVIDDLAAQAEVVAEVASGAASNIVASAKKEVDKAVKEVKAKKTTANKKTKKTSK